MVELAPAVGGLRILILMDTYVPTRISGALQMHDLARELVAEGHVPTVVAPASDLDCRWRFDHIDGIRVLRVRAPRTKDVGLVRRAIAESLLPFAMISGVRRSPLEREGWDAAVWYSPSIFLGPVVAWAKRRQCCRAYLILRDLFPDWALDAGLMRRGLAYRYFKAVERYQYAVADVIGVQTPANVPIVKRDVRRVATRIEVLNNWLTPPVVTSCAFDLARTSLAGRTVFVYAGNMGAAQSLDCVLDLADAMRNEPVGFLLVGRGSDVPRLKAIASDRRLEAVLFVDEVPAADIPAMLAQCHIGLIALDPRHTTHNIPGKLLTYLHAGLPVLARINPGNDLQAVINGADVGRVTAGDDREQLLGQAREMVRDPQLRARMAVAGRALALREFSTAAVAAQIVDRLRAPGLR